jgi:hypothetical protein
LYDIKHTENDVKHTTAIRKLSICKIENKWENKFLKAKEEAKQKHFH